MTANAEKYVGKTSRAALAKHKIMNTAANLFAERGYGNVGINEVCVTAGFGKGALYYHIQSKEDLLVSIIAEHMQGLIESAHEIVGSTSGTRDRVQSLTVSFVDKMVQNPDAMTVCFRDIHAIFEPHNQATVKSLHEVYKQVWTSTFNDGATRGEHRQIAPIEVQTLLGMYFCTVLWARSEPMPYRDAISQTLSRTVLDTVMSHSN